MITKFKDYDEIQVFEGGAQLPVGGYELTIVGAKVEQFTNCEILKIAFDIVNHEQFSGFYANRFKSAKAQNPDAKWGGVFDVFIPKDDGSELDGYTKQAFKRFITSVEKSNEGYVWNWDEKSLKGKAFGGIFGREEFITKEGDRKFAVKCRFPRSIDSIRNGDYKVPEDKLLKGLNTATATLGDYEEILNPDDMPF